MLVDEIEHPPLLALLFSLCIGKYGKSRSLPSRFLFVFDSEPRDRPFTLLLELCFKRKRPGELLFSPFFFFFVERQQFYRYCSLLPAVQRSLLPLYRLIIILWCFSLVEICAADARGIL